ncbi:Chromatin-associated swi6 [Lecanosticta acicola]|uniref:Chromatin-associated swi6 n=1 Tax=Lecanosticta acicola TaxID=111012 RepID=A0AAI9E6E9_9PEZI|nr:Chromatin-associated swi6 [Lecanosticta acicola]
MPPQMSDDESDNMSIPDQIPAKKSTKAPAQDEEDEDEAEEGDEFQVEKIMDHKIQKKKVLYKVKWLGWDNEDDMTWEPIENLSNSPDLVEAYHVSIGGTPEPAGKGSAKKGPAAGKRSASAAFDSPAPTGSGKKRSRKSDANGDAWEPPVGSWEDHVERVAAILEEEEEVSGIIKKGKTDVQSLKGLLEWVNGKKSEHKMSLLRQKCPQRLLDYYESHL